jgi:hypothetical protein
MKIKRAEKKNQEVIEIEVDGEKIEMHFLPVLKTDYFFLTTSPDFEALAKWVLKTKLTAIKGVEFEDGEELKPSDAYELPIGVLFEAVGKYAEKIKQYSEAMNLDEEQEKKTISKE